MKCNRCGKEIEGKVYHVEDFDLCLDCYKKAEYELGHSKTLKIGG